MASIANCESLPEGINRFLGVGLAGYNKQLVKSKEMRSQLVLTLGLFEFFSSILRIILGAHVWKNNSSSQSQFRQFNHNQSYLFLLPDPFSNT